MKTHKKKMIDLFTYVALIFIDAFCFNIFLKLELGTYPFGIFVDNVGQNLMISNGIIAFIVATTQIYLASKLKNTRIKYESLIYSLLFSIFVDFQSFFIKSLNINMNFYNKVIILLLIIFLLDISRTLFKVLPYPKLPFLELLYGIKERYSIDLKWANRLSNLFFFTIGIIFSYFNQNFFHGVGVGTILNLIFSGVALNYFSPWMQSFYVKYTQ